MANDHLRSQVEALNAEKRNLEIQSLRYHDFFDFAPDGYLVTNTDGIIQEANQAATSLFNVAHDVLVGKKLRLFVARQDERLFDRQMQRVKAGEVQKLQDWEIQIHPYEGIPFPAAVTLGVTTKGISGKAAGLRWLFRDISERKKADEILKRSRQQLSDFVENAAIPLHWLSREGKIIWANQAELDLLGYSRDEFLGHSMGEFHENPNEVSLILEQLKNNETITNFETRLICKDGSVRHVLLDCNVNWEGEQFMHARCFVRDITERKMAEEQIRQLNSDLERRVRDRTEQLEQENSERKRIEQELRATSKELYLLTNSIGDYLWSAEVMDSGSLVYRFFSPVVEKITGHPAEYFLSNSNRWWDIVHPADRDRLKKTYRKASVGGGPRAEEEFRILKPDGSVRWLRDCVLATQGPDGLRLNGVVSDITERKAAERRSAVEHGVTRVIMQSESFNEAILEVLKCVCENLGWDRGEFWRVSLLEEELRCHQFWQSPEVKFGELEKICRQTSFAKGFGLAGRVWASHSPVIVPDISRDATFFHAREASQEGVRGAYGFPIRNNKKLLGVLTFFTREAQKLDSSLLQIFNSLTNQLALFGERTAAMKELRHSEERFRILFDTVDDMMALIDRHGLVIREVNPSLEKCLGTPSSKIQGKKITELVLPGDQDYLTSKLDDAFAGKKVEPFVVSVRCRGTQVKEMQLVLKTNEAAPDHGQLLLICRGILQKTAEAAPASRGVHRPPKPAVKPRGKTKPKPKVVRRPVKKRARK